MKKRSNIILCSIITFLVFAAFIILLNFPDKDLADAAEPEKGTEASAAPDNTDIWHDSEGNVIYPITPLSAEWKERTYAENRNATNIPKTILEPLSTRQLLELALDYPFALDIFAYDDFSKGFDNLVNSTNVYNELLQREDLADVLIADFNELSLKSYVNEDEFDPDAHASVCSQFFDVFLQYILDTKSLTNEQEAALKSLKTN